LAIDRELSRNGAIMDTEPFGVGVITVKGRLARSQLLREQATVVREASRLGLESGRQG